MFIEYVTTYNFAIPLKVEQIAFCQLETKIIQQNSAKFH